jgi:hypothetical protein
MGEVKLTKVQLVGLRELAAVHDSEGRSWVRPQHLCGTPEERSSANYQSLMALGLVNGKKTNPQSKQGQWRWQINPAGRLALQEATHDK